MDTKRIESFKQFAKYLEYPMVVFEAETGKVLDINYEAEVLLGSSVDHIQIEPGRAFTKLNFWELLHGKKSLIWHRIRMMADGKEYLVSGLVNETVTEDKLIYTLLFERRADLNIGSLTLENIVNHAGIVAAHIGRNEDGFEVEYVSQNINQYGYTRAQLYEKIVRIEDIICAEDLERVSSIMEEASSKQLNENSLECRLLTEERQLIPVRLMIHYIYNDYGKLSDCEILIMDLREELRKNSENRYLSTAVSKMRNVVLIKSYNEDRRTLKYISPNAEMVGMNVEALQKGYKLTEDYIHPEDRDGVIDAIYQAVTSGMTDYVQRYRMVQDDGKKIWVENIITVNRISDGEAEISFLLTDITEQKEMEEELAAFMKLSEDSEKTQGKSPADVKTIDKDNKEMMEQLQLMAETLGRNADYYTAIIDINGQLLTNPEGPARDLGQFYDLFERPLFKEQFSILSEQAKEQMIPQTTCFDFDAVSMKVHLVLAPLLLKSEITAYWVLTSFEENGAEILNAAVQQQWKLTNAIVGGFYAQDAIRQENHRNKVLEMRLSREQQARSAMEDMISAFSRGSESCLNEMCQKAGMYLSLENIGLYLANKETGRVETYFVWNRTGGNIEFFNMMKASPAGYQEIKKRFREKPILVADKKTEDSAIKDYWLRQTNMSGLIIAQMPFHTDLEGYVVLADANNDREFDKRDVNFAMTLAGMVAGIIQNSRQGNRLEILQEGFLDAYNHIRDAVFVKNNRSGEIIFANKAVDKLFGYSIVGMQAAEIISNQMDQYRNIQSIRQRLIAGKKVTKWQSYLKELDQIMNIVEVNLDTINGTDCSLVILKKNKNKDKKKDK